MKQKPIKQPMKLLKPKEFLDDGIKPTAQSTFASIPKLKTDIPLNEIDKLKAENYTLRMGNLALRAEPLKPAIQQFQAIQAQLRQLEIELQAWVADRQKAYAAEGCNLDFNSFEFKRGAEDG